MGKELQYRGQITRQAETIRELKDEIARLSSRNAELESSTTMVAVREFLDSKAAELNQLVCSERDQLKAELAGLRTGYEAYESVNMGLKAEVERLRSVRETMLCAAHELGLPVGAGAQDVVDAIHSMQVLCAELSKSLKTLIHISNATNWEAHTCGEIDKARNLLAAMGKGEQA